MGLHIYFNAGLFLSFLSLYTSISGLKPEVVRTLIDGHYLVVAWQYPPIDDNIEGYYVSLCLMVESACKAPDFVHFDKLVRSGRIIGLAPESHYELKVIAYGLEGHVSSSPWNVDTRRLLFLEASNLTLLRITYSTALFQWNHEAKNNIHDVHFKLSCAGMRQFVDLSGNIVQEEDQFQHLSHSTSENREIFLAENLEVNTKYNCIMSSLSGNIESPPSQEISFSTLPGSPTIPPTPVLSLSHDNTFTASISSTNERYGPISHYLLIAVPVFRPNTEPLTAPFTSLVPLKEIFLKALSVNMVTRISQPLPFIVSSFKPTDLPINYNFGYEWRTVFKKKTYYSVVLVAFTKAMNNSNGHGLYSLSALSDPPVYITEDLVEDWIEKQMPVARRFTIIVTCSFATVIFLFALALLILCISNYYQAKRRDAKNDYMFIISDTGSSDEEIFSRGKQKCDVQTEDKGLPTNRHSVHNTPTRPQNVLSQKSPHMTSAEWAMENMAKKSPAFREMILNHPESLDDVNNVMTKIGEKWNSSQYRTGDGGEITSGMSLNNPSYQQEYEGTSSKHAHCHVSTSGSSFSEPLYAVVEPTSKLPPPPLPPPLPKGHPR